VVTAPARDFLHESSNVTGENSSDDDSVTVVRKKRTNPSLVNPSAIANTDTVSNSKLLDLIFSKLSNLCITNMETGLVKPDNNLTSLIININLPFATLFKMHIGTVNSRLGIMHRFIILSQLLTGLVCMVPPLSILLSPASMLLFKMPWNRQLPLA
jgi:hypothetical protein